MTDENSSGTPPVSITALEKAKQMQDRITRNKNALISMSTTVEVKRNALVYAKKRLKEAQEDVERLSVEIPILDRHIEQLNVWCGKNLESDEQMQMATALAKKIQKLQKELEAKRQALHRLEAGLPEY